VNVDGRQGDRVGGGLGPNYWKLWVSSASSNLADGVFWIAFPLFAIQLTDSPALIAGVVVVSRLPWLVFVLFAGALADRLDRRRTMVAIAALRTGVAAALAAGILADVVNLPILYLTAFVLGVGETLFDTAAQSIMPNIVDRDRLSQANGRLYAAELTTNQFVGPPLGGLLAGVAVALAFAGSALAFAVAAVGLSLLVGSFRPAPERPTSIVEDIREGLAHLWHNTVLRTLAIMVGVMNLAGAATFAILVLYAVAPGPMGLDEVGFGMLMTAMGIGSLAGSLVVERVERRLGRARLLALAVLVGAVMMAVPGITPNAWIVGASFAASGLVFMMWNVVTVSLRQRIVPDRLLGRVNASYRLLAWGGQPLGAMLGGVAAEVFGLQAVFLLAGVLSATLLLGNRILTEAAIAAAERAGDEEASAGADTERASEAAAS
jgi:MFS family permease